MILGERLRALREVKNLSQGDVEERTGLLRCYVSRVEHGHTVPSVGTLEKLARALEVPIYQLFYEGEELPKIRNLPKSKTAADITWGCKGKEAHMLAKFCRLFRHTSESNVKLLFYMAEKMARRKPAYRK